MKHTGAGQGCMCCVPLLLLLLPVPLLLLLLLLPVPVLLVQLPLLQLPLLQPLPPPLPVVSGGHVRACAPHPPWCCCIHGVHAAKAPHGCCWLHHWPPARLGSVSVAAQLPTGPPSSPSPAPPCCRGCLLLLWPMHHVFSAVVAFDQPCNQTLHVT
jgi:hypothetical protein